MSLVKVIFHPGENIYKHFYFQGDITVLPIDESRPFRILNDEVGRKAEALPKDLDICISI